ncbi:MAG: trehalose-phosphatase [Burkholderiaceae bacterium]
MPLAVTSQHSSAHSLLVDRLIDSNNPPALFLDVDGTLIDIAATPDAVHVPDALPALIAGLAHHLEGAIALVSGRTIAELDQLFAPIRLACAGGHGAQLRFETDGAIADTPLRHELAPALVEGVAELARLDDRLLFEDKQTSIALHYRAAPDMTDKLRRLVDDLVAATTAPGDVAPDLIAGKMIYEIKAAGFDKGKAVSQFIDRDAFSSRPPIMIGDDTTDEKAFAQVRALGGIALGVGDRAMDVDAVFQHPADVRHALSQVLAVALNRTLNF